MLVDDGFAARLAGMLEYVHQSMKPDLTHPMLGDGDQMLSDDREHWEAKVLLAARSVLFRRPLYQPFQARLNDTVLWFLGLDANAVPTTSVEPASAAYPTPAWSCCAAAVITSCSTRRRLGTLPTRTMVTRMP